MKYIGIKKRHTPSPVVLVWTCIFISLMADVAGGGTIYIKRETVRGELTATNGSKWLYGYDIEAKEGKIFIHVAINLIPAGGVTRMDVDRVKDKWKRGIEKVWSNRFALKIPSGEIYPILVEVTFMGPEFHHEVIVHPPGRGTDELNWHIYDTPEMVAHEVGHMLGVYDEYRGGATNPQRSLRDRTSIMKRGATGGITYSRHYERIRHWFIDKTGLKGVEIVKIK